MIQAQPAPAAVHCQRLEAVGREVDRRVIERLAAVVHDDPGELLDDPRRANAARNLDGEAQRWFAVPGEGKVNVVPDSRRPQRRDGFFADAVSVSGVAEESP